MTQSKAERAASLLRETAALLDMLPRRIGLFGPMLATENMRAEADWLEARVAAWQAATEPADGP